MDVVQQTIQTYDKIAPEYCEKTRIPKFMEWEDGYVKRLLSFISTRKPLILTVGCGDGRDNMYVEKNGGHAIGIDLSEGMLKEARRWYPEGDFRKMDMRHLLFEDDYFDGIWASGSIYHVPKSEVREVVKEFKRVLKQYGLVAVNFKLGEGEGMVRNPKSYSGSPRYFAYYKKEEMKNLFEEQGFDEIDSCLYPEEIFEATIQQMWFKLRGKE